jgi:PAS domain S-box-containing protein
VPGRAKTTHLDLIARNQSCFREGVGTWEWNISTNRVYADQALAQLFGMDPEQASYGLPIEAFTAGIHPDDRGWVESAIREAEVRSGPFVNEYRTCPRHGEVRWVLARGRFYHDAFGRPRHSRGLVIDITDFHGGEVGASAWLASCTDTPLERVADLVLSAREVLTEADHAFLLKLTDMLLLEVGRELAQREKIAQQRRMN